LLCAQVAITHGDFDALISGTAPDVGAPAGPWGFLDKQPDTLETDPGQMSIVATSSFQDGAAGNSLRLFADNMPGTVNTHVSNNFLSPYVEGSASPLIVSFDLWVPAGAGGGSMYVGKGSINTADRGPQLSWLADGSLAYNAGAGNIPAVTDSIRDAWQSIRLEIDLVTDTFDLYYGAQGGPLTLAGDNLGFRSGALDTMTRFTFVNFGGTTPSATSYLDNVVVIPAPGAAALLLIGGVLGGRRRR
jgi:uncharacterized protein (TIGR03382 family)